MEKIDWNDFLTDKNPKRHNYVEIYEWLFNASGFREAPINILEMGVAHGESIKLWKAMFPNANIFGLDNSPKCNKSVADYRTHIFIGNQKNQEILDQLVCHPKVRSVGFHIIVDDAGHRPEAQRKAFEFLVKFLADGGFYIIEDLFFAYRNKFTPEKNKSIVEFLKGLVDDVLHRGKTNYADPRNAKVLDALNWYERHLYSIIFIRGMCIVHKLDKFDDKWTIQKSYT